MCLISNNIITHSLHKRFIKTSKGLHLTAKMKREKSGYSAHFTVKQRNLWHYVSICTIIKRNSMERNWIRVSRSSIHSREDGLGRVEVGLLTHVGFWTLSCWQARLIWFCLTKVKVKARNTMRKRKTNHIWMVHTHMRAHTHTHTHTHKESTFN